MRKIKVYLFLCCIVSFSWASMIKPSNGISINYTHVLFEWQQEPNAEEYEVQISTSSSFSSPITNTTESLIYIDTQNLAWNNTYYWRVRSVYSDGSSGDWIDTFSFSITSSITSADITMHSSVDYQEGVTFLGSLDGNFSAAFDKDGDEIWNTASDNIIIYNTNLMGELYGCRYDPSLQHSYPVMEFDLDGNYIWEESNEDFAHHDMVRLPDGN